MIDYVKTWLELKTDRRAVTALEYGLIAALMATVLVAAVGTFGTHLTNTFKFLGTSLGH